jgi:hypothetical protein
MKQTLEGIIQQLDDELSTIKMQLTNTIEISEKAIKTVLQTLFKIKDQVIKYGFLSNDDEILFFKHIKPKVLSKLIYYMKLLEIESHRYNYIEKYQIKYLNKNLKKLHHYIGSQYELKQYMVCGKKYMDELYFLRINNKNQIQPDNICIILDHNFSTAQDYNIAKYLAYEMLIKYVQNEISKLKKVVELADKEQTTEPLSDVKWTGTSIGLVELLYAVHSVGAFNNGNKDIKEIATVFAKLLNIELGDFYRTFQDIKSRKKDKTAFLDKLKQALLQKIDESDELKPD